MGMHADQLAISPQTVRELVDEQFPRWRGQDIRAVDAPGTVNAIFRIGERFAARFPWISWRPGIFSRPARDG
jgi:aminoglycoside phosphotransferase (APT) family kinase protein